MARPAQITRENLAPLIRARGPVSATELAGLLRVNRTTISRALPDFGDDLVTLGASWRMTGCVCLMQVAVVFLKSLASTGSGRAGGAGWFRWRRSPRR